MDDKQENRFNMFIKTTDFLGDYAMDLSSIPEIATTKTWIDAKIAAIVDADGDADSDSTGYTIQKSLERGHLEKITLKVSRAVAAYGVSINNPGLVRLADYVPSALENMRSTDLYVKAKQLFKIADPISTSLSGFNSGPADVTELSGRMADYFNVLQLPEEKRGEKKASGILVDELFTDIDQKLVLLDIYMATFDAVNSLLYNKYLSARSIDETGGGSQNNKTGKVGYGAVANIPFADGKIESDTVLKLKTLDNFGDLIFYFSALPTGGPDTATETITVAGNSETEIVAGLKGFTVGNHFLNVKNTNAVDIKWRAEIL